MSYRTHALPHNTRIVGQDFAGRTLVQDQYNKFVYSDWKGQGWMFERVADELLPAVPFAELYGYPEPPVPVAERFTFAPRRRCGKPEAFGAPYGVEYPHARAALFAYAEEDESAAATG